MTEICPHCNNTVAGIFSPSATRKVLTSIAKKGGMKAVLTYVGTVFPGIGNIGGFLAGAALDLIYGDDINKFIDKIADVIDDNKIYVFTCPQCGHEWSRKEEDLENDDELLQSYSESYTESASSTANSYIENFNKNFHYFLDQVDVAIEDTKATEILSTEMERFAVDTLYSDVVIASQYFFLAGLCDLLYAKKRYPDTNSRRQLKQAKKNLQSALDLQYDDEYKLMLAATKTLLCTTPQKCIREGTIETASYKFENDTLFKEDWLIEIYEECRFKSILRADKVIDKAVEGKYDDDIRVELWSSGLSLQDKDYRMICYLNVSIYCTNREEGEKVSLEEAESLNAVVNTQGYSIENCDVNNFYDRGWLEGCVYLAQSIIQNENPYVDKDIKEQFNILERISDFVECYAGFLACTALGSYYEKGIVVEKNISKALCYYKKVGCEEDIARLMAELRTSGRTVSSGTSSSISDSESEYLEEVKECLKNGVISNGERRLLEKLRVKLGISESRATEIEASLLRPQLTEEEQEYLNEYKECIKGGGVITSGERRLLNKLRITLGLSELQAEELEKI